MNPSLTPLRMQPYFWGVALISFFVMAMEVSLTRYFATATFSTYGYFIISIALFGFSVSGTLLTLFQPFFVRHQRALLFALPLILMPVTMGSYLLLGLNDFNILEFQNRLLWGKQISNIALYYLVLFFPYFFAGLYIGIAFIVCREHIGKAYAYDLIAAAIGGVVILGLMFVTHPFVLVMWLLPLLALTSLAMLPARRRLLWFGLTLVVTLAAGFLLQSANTARYSKYKPIFAPLNVQGNQTIAQIKSPRGYYEIIDNFTERVDIDLSNNYETLKITAPPLAYGLYRDGYRVSEFKKNADAAELGYVPGMLSALPYTLRPQPQTLVMGLNGGYRIREALALKAAQVTALDPNPDYLSLLQRYARANADILQSPQVTLKTIHPRAFVARHPATFDVIDVSSQMIPQGEADYLYTLKAIKDYVLALKPGGIASLPMGIRENYIYALKLLVTVRQALQESGVTHPEQHIIFYRTAWMARILVSNQPFRAADIEKTKQFCDDRSFDVSFYPGITPESVSVWNELPELKIHTGEQAPSAPTGLNLQGQDALLSASLKLLAPESSSAANLFRHEFFFELLPATDDKPFFLSVLRWDKLPQVPDNLSVIPLEEMNYLVNWVILIQATCLGLLILLLPLLRQGTYASSVGRGRMILYFVCLGLGYFFVEVTLIEKFKLVLNDPTYAFAIVLGGMLICSGLGSMASERLAPQQAIRMATVAIALSMVFYTLVLDSVVQFLFGLPFGGQIAIILLVAGVPAFFLGMPFPVGLSCLSGSKSYFVPWAWSINGAFSVVSAVLTKILFVSFGYNFVLLISGAIYLLAWATFSGFLAPDQHSMEHERKISHVT